MNIQVVWSDNLTCKVQRKSNLLNTSKMEIFNKGLVKVVASINATTKRDNPS